MRSAGEMLKATELDGGAKEIGRNSNEVTNNNRVKPTLSDLGLSKNETKNIII